MPNFKRGVSAGQGFTHIETSENNIEDLSPQSFEALRRSYAEAGFTMVDGSFEEGGTLASSSDVLLHKATGIAYSGPIGQVAADTDPLIGGIFVDKSSELLRSSIGSQLSAKADISYVDFQDSNLQTQINDIANQIISQASKYGLSGTPATGTDANSYQWIPNQPVVNSGTLVEFQTYASTSGTVQIGVYTKTGSNTFTRRSDYVSVDVVAGLNIIALAIPVTAGEYLGIATQSVGLTQYIAGAANSFPIYNAPLGTTTGFYGPSGGHAWQFNFSVKNTGNLASKKWKNLKYVSFGDSITWYNGKQFVSTHIESKQLAIGYQSYIVEALGCTLDNQGASGYTMPEIYANRVSGYDFTGAYAVTLTSGANDHRKAVAPGSVAAIGSSFNTATFAGAMQASIEKIIASNKATKIFLITPIRGWFTESGTTNVPGPYNGEMMISDDYVSVINQIGQMYSIPVIDWYNNIGVNDLNKNYFLGDNPDVFTAYLLHPKNLCFKQMGEMLLSRLADF